MKRINFSYFLWCLFFDMMQYKIFIVC